MCATQMRRFVIELTRRITSVKFLFLCWVMLCDALTSVRTCSTNSDCNIALGQSCYRHYEGCYTGRCMCDAKTPPGPSGHCSIVKLGGERCSGRDVCHDGLDCRDGVCQCQSGSTMTSDGTYCLRSTERLVGQSCSRSENQCVHKLVDGYTRSEVHCSYRRLCECKDGYKTIGVSCTHWNINEPGCSLSQQCSGGAICLFGQCICPSEFSVSATGLKCERRGAVTGLPLGARCDEINEQRYCDEGLICLRCSKDTTYKCVKFLMANEYAYLSSGFTFWISIRTVISLQTALCVTTSLLLAFST